MKQAVKRISRLLGVEVKRRTLPTIPMTSSWLTRFEYLSDRYRAIQGVPGDIVECGVGKGGTIAMFAHLMSRDTDGTRMLWGFDSFQGFPKPSPEDNSFRNPQEGDWGDTSKELVESLVLGTGISKEFLASRIRLVEGFFENTMCCFPQERAIALLHVDVDLYKSYLDVLTSLYPKVPSGGAVLFDEYHEDRWPGATKAIDEYLAAQGVRDAIQQDSRCGKYFLIKP